MSPGSQDEQYREKIQAWSSLASKGHLGIPTALDILLAADCGSVEPAQRASSLVRAAAAAAGIELGAKPVSATGTETVLGLGDHLWHCAVGLVLGARAHHPEGMSFAFAVLARVTSGGLVSQCLATDCLGALGAEDSVFTRSTPVSGADARCLRVCKAILMALRLCLPLHRSTSSEGGVSERMLSPYDAVCLHPSLHLLAGLSHSLSSCNRLLMPSHRAALRASNPRDVYLRSLLVRQRERSESRDSQSQRRMSFARGLAGAEEQGRRLSAASQTTGDGDIVAVSGQKLARSWPDPSNWPPGDSVVGLLCSQLRLALEVLSHVDLDGDTMGGPMEDTVGPPTP